MRKHPVAVLALAGLIAAPMAPATPAFAQSGSPLDSIFHCQAEGNKQEGGAAVGAVLGGILGNTTASKRSRGLGTVLGAAVGAAAGSYIGCRMQTSDQRRAEAATQEALQYGRDTSWTNPETGAYGRVNVVDSRPYDGRRYEPVSLRGVRFASGVQPQGRYMGGGGQYEADRRVNLRGEPSTRGQVLTRLRPGERFDALARVQGYDGDWILAGRNNVAIGYVAESVVRPVDGGYAYDDRDRYASSSANGPVCRTFDQTVTTGRGDTQTQRYTACQTPNGQWVVQA